MPYYRKEDGSVVEVYDAPSVGQVMSDTSGTNPDEVAEIKNLSKKLKISPDIIKMNKPLAQRIAAAPDLSILDNTAPVLAGMSRDHGFMALASDDMYNLARIEQKNEEVRRVRQADDNKKASEVINKMAFNWIPDFVKNTDAFREFASGQAIDRVGMIATLQKELRAKGQDLNPQQKKYLQDMQTVAKYDTQKEGFGSWVASASEIVGQMYEGATSPDKNPLKLATAASAAAAGTAAMMSGPTAQVTVPVAAVGGFASGMRAGMFLRSKAVEGGNAYLELQDMKDENGKPIPIDEKTARVASDMVGVINGSLELVGFEHAVKLVPGLNKVMKDGAMGVIKKNPTVRKAFIDYAKKVAGATAAETTTESMQELTNIFTEGFLKDKDVMDVVKDPETHERVKGIMEKVAKGTLLLGGLGGSVDLGRNINTARKYQKAVEVHEALMDTLTAKEQSLLSKRSNEDLADFMQRKADRDGNEFIYLQSDRVIDEATKAGMSPEEMTAWLDQYGVKKSDLDAAIERGGNISLEYGKTIAGMNADEVLTKLKDDMMVDPDISPVSTAMEDALAENNTMQRLTELYQAEQDRMVTADDLDMWEKDILSQPGLKGKVTRDSLSLLIARSNMLAKLTGNKAVDHLNRMLMPDGLRAMKFADFAAEQQAMRDANGQPMMQMTHDFEQEGNYTFNEAEHRAPVMGWAKQQFGEAVAPNGKPAWQNFTKWFGDSKAVDADGKPLVVYHGSGTAIEAFDPSFTGKGNDQLGSGFYFTTNNETAKGYETATLPFSGERKLGGDDNPNTVEAYVTIKKPIYLDESQDNLRDVFLTPKQVIAIIKKAPNIYDADESGLVNWIDNNGKPFTDAHISKVAKEYENLISIENDFFDGDATVFREAVYEATGYDGVIKTFSNGEKHFVAWFPTQIKSVSNQGNYSPTDASILNQSGTLFGTNSRPYGFAGMSQRAQAIADKLSDIIAVGDGTIAPDVLYSSRTWTVDEKAQIKELAKQMGIAEDKVDKWLYDIDNAMARVLADPSLDFIAEAADLYSALKPNSDPHYTVSLDFSTLCRKRYELVATIEAIQNRIGKAVTKELWVDIRQMLDDMGYNVSCGACYVDSKRMEAGKFINKFIDEHPEEDPRQFLSQAGIDQLKRDNPKLYAKFKKAIGSNNAKTPESRTDYHGEIRWYFLEGKDFDNKATQQTGQAAWTKNKNAARGKKRVDAMNKKSGLRWQSWSDFEVPHLMDAMQAVLDMHMAGLMGHAYTKVPDFVLAMGKTGLMVNMSLIPKGTGLAEDGTLIFDSKEGMPFDIALQLRDAHEMTAGTIAIGVNNDHISAMLKDPRIDYVIPYHASGLSKEIAKRFNMDGWEDYTDTQTEDIKDYELFHKVVGHKDKKLVRIMLKVNDPAAWVKEETKYAKSEMKKIQEPKLTKSGIPSKKQMTELEIKKKVASLKEYLSELEAYGESVQGMSDEDLSDEKVKSIAAYRKAAKASGLVNIDTTEYWDDTKSGDDNAKVYLALAESRGVLPKFRGKVYSNGKVLRDFTQEPGYWKLLIDRKMYDHSGNNIVQEAVKPEYDEAAIKDIFDRASGNPTPDAAAADVVNHFSQQEGYTGPLMQSAGIVDITDTPEFKQWFGESKVVDAEGKPLVVYHGGRKGIEQFKNPDGKYKTGIFFAADKSVADAFGQGGETYSVYLSIQNPFVLDAEGNYYSDIPTPKEMQDYAVTDEVDTDLVAEWAFKNGYDGVILKNVLEGRGNKESDIYIASKDIQIKSATGNRGTFDPNNPNILMQSFAGMSQRAGELADGTTTIDVDGVQRHALNSNGQPIHWSEEGISNFWRWFGDSKVVDAEGKPLVVYHGSKNKFTEFEHGHGDFYEINNQYGPGFYLTNHKKSATSYGKNVIEGYASIQNPITRKTNFFTDDAIRQVLDRADYAFGQEWNAWNQRQDKSAPKSEIVDEFIRRQSNNNDLEKIKAMVKWFKSPETMKQAIADVTGADGVIAKDVLKDIDVFTVFSPTQIKSVFNRGTFDPNNPNILMQSAWHGSPHTFDKFSTSAIGTGEGAQAYGYGLYFAGAKDVAEWYRDKLSREDGTIVRKLMEAIESSGVALKGLDMDAFYLLAAEYAYRQGNIKETIKNANMMARTYASDGDSDAADGLRGVVSAIESAIDKGVKLPEMSKGRLYKVELAPSEDEYLLWDKPLSEQSEKVKAALGGGAEYFEVGVTGEADSGKYYNDRYVFYSRKEADAFIERTKAEGSDIDIQLYEYDQEEDADYLARVMPDGNQLYYQMIEEHGSDRAASEYLHSLGIRGIKYEDGNTRGKSGWQMVATKNGKVISDKNFATRELAEQAGKDLQGGVSGVTYDVKETASYNYVIFSDDDVAISEMYQKQKKQQQQNDNKETYYGALTKPDGQNLITLFEKADKSTFLHETGHIFLNDIKFMAENHGIQVELWDEIKQWLNVGENGVLTREMHEKFAEHFEVYLMEGKAPSIGLRDVFRQFKSWLTKIYEVFTSKRFGQREGININPEIRAILDRTLATDLEIRQAQEQSAMLAMLNDELLRNTGFTQEQLDEYRKVAIAADDSAREKRDKHKLVGLKDRMAGWQEQAERESRGEPVYGFIDWIIETGVSRQSIVEQFGEEGIHKNSPMFKKDGMPIDQAIAQHGEQFGYESAGAFVHDFRNMQPKDKFIEKRVAQLEAEYFSEQDTQDAIRTASLRKLLEMESEWLAKQIERDAATQAKNEAEYNKAWQDAEQKLAIAITEGKMQAEIDKLREAARQAKADRDAAFRTQREKDKPVMMNGRKVTKREILRAWAEKTIAKRTIKEIFDTRSLLAESRKNRQAAIKYAKEQNWSAALDANEKARMAEELIAASLRARDRFTKMQRKWNRAINSKSINYDYHQQLMRLLIEYKATNRKLDINPDTPSFLQFMEKMNLAAGDEIDMLDLPAVPAFMGEEVMPLKEMSWEQIQDFGDMMAFLEGRGRDVQDALLADGVTRVSEAREAALESADKVKRNMLANIKKHGTMLRKAQDFIRGYLARNQILLFTMRAMDGETNIGKGGVAGNNEQMIWRPLMDGVNRKMQLKEKINAILNPHLEHLIKRANEEFGKLPLPDQFKRYGYSWTWERVVAVALNRGNESNLQRLMGGFTYNGQQMTMEHVDEILSSLKADDWKAVQGIWDGINTLFPELNDTHKKINFFPMKKIPAQAFTVYLSDGTTMEMNGGYYPVRFDPVIDKEMGQWSEKDDILNRTESLRQVPSPKSGMTKAREQGNVQRPLKLQIGVLGEHVEDVINYIALAQAVRDADRITKNNEYAMRAEEVLGVEGQLMIRAHLKGIIRPEQTPKNEVERWIEKSRTLMSAYAMAYNLWTALQNLTGVFPLLHDVGVRNFLNGAASVAKDPIAAYKTMTELSPYMKNRMDNVDRDVRKHTKNFKPQFNVKGMTIDDIRDAGFWGIKSVDMMNAMPAWWGSYNKAIADGMRQDEAIKFADTKIQSSQGSGLPIDLSDHQRAQGMMRFFTNFMTFAITQQNILAQHVRGLREGSITKGQYAYGVLMALVLPALTTTILKAAVTKGEPPEPEEIVGDMVGYGFMGFPFLRDVVSASTNKVLKKGYSQTGFRMASLETTKVLTDFFGDSLKLGEAIIHGEDTDKHLHRVVWDAAVVGSMATGLPASSLYRKWERGKKQIEDNGGHWWNLLIPSQDVKVTVEELFD